MNEDGEVREGHDRAGNRFPCHRRPFEKIVRGRKVRSCRGWNGSPSSAAPGHGFPNLFIVTGHTRHRQNSLVYMIEAK